MQKGKSYTMKNISKRFSKEPVDFVLLVIVLVMLGLGIIMVMSASAPTSLAKTGNSYKYVKTQALSAGLGIVAMLVISNIDYKIYKRFDKLIYMVVLVLLASVAVIGTEDGGAKRWIDLGFINFQPSEVAKIGLIIFYASLLTKNKERLGDMWGGFFYPLMYLLPIIAILPDTDVSSISS